MKFYRYRWQHIIPPFDKGGDDYVKEIVLDQFDLIKETPCGYWIDVKPKRKWVSKNSVKRFAYPTRSEAAWNFRCRIKSRIPIVRGLLEDLEDIDRGLELIPQSAELNGVIIQEKQKLIQCK